MRRTNSKGRPLGSPRFSSRHPALDRMRFLFTMSDIGRSLRPKRRKTFQSPSPPQDRRRRAFPRKGNETDKIASEG
jgi:hypothetical protein